MGYQRRVHGDTPAQEAPKALRFQPFAPVTRAANWFAEAVIRMQHLMKVFTLAIVLTIACAAEEACPRNYFMGSCEANGCLSNNTLFGYTLGLQPQADTSSELSEDDDDETEEPYLKHFNMQNGFCAEEDGTDSDDGITRIDDVNYKFKSDAEKQEGCFDKCIEMGSTACEIIYPGKHFSFKEGCYAHTNPRVTRAVDRRSCDMLGNCIFATCWIRNSQGPTSKCVATAKTENSGTDITGKCCVQCPANLFSFRGAKNASGCLCNSRENKWQNYETGNKSYPFGGITGVESLEGACILSCNKDNCAARLGINVQHRDRRLCLGENLERTSAHWDTHKKKYAPAVFQPLIVIIILTLVIGACIARRKKPSFDAALIGWKKFFDRKTAQEEGEAALDDISAKGLSFPDLEAFFESLTAVISGYQLTGAFFVPGMGWNIKGPYVNILPLFTGLVMPFDLGALPMAESSEIACYFSFVVGVLGIGSTLSETLSCGGSNKVEDADSAKSHEDGKLEGVADRTAQISSFIGENGMMILTPMLMSPWVCDFPDCGNAEPVYKGSTEKCWTDNPEKATLASMCSVALFFLVIGTILSSIKIKADPMGTGKEISVNPYFTVLDVIGKAVVGGVAIIPVKAHYEWAGFAVLCVGLGYVALLFYWYWTRPLSCCLLAEALEKVQDKMCLYCCCCLPACRCWCNLFCCTAASLGKIPITDKGVNIIKRCMILINGYAAATAIYVVLLPKGDSPLKDNAVGWFLFASLVTIVGSIGFYLWAWKKWKKESSQPGFKKVSAGDGLYVQEGL